MNNNTEIETEQSYDTGLVLRSCAFDEGNLSFKTDQSPECQMLALAWAVTLYSYSRADEIELGIWQPGKAQTASIGCNCQLKRYRFSDPQQSISDALQDGLKDEPGPGRSPTPVSLEWDRTKQFHAIIELCPSKEDLHLKLRHKRSNDGVEGQKDQSGELTILWSFDHEGIELGLVQRETIFDAAQVRRLLHHIRSASRAIITRAPEDKIDAIDIISDEDRCEIERWNATYPYGLPAFAAKPSPEVIQDLVSVHAKQTPHAVAVDAWDGQLTYLQLGRLSSQLAAHLIDRGILPGQIVRICFEKSLCAVVAILAILKTVHDWDD